jgi:hypothetical protein
MYKFLVTCREESLSLFADNISNLTSGYDCPVAEYFTLMGAKWAIT